MGLIKIDKRGTLVYQRIYPVYKNCVGCRICEIVCSLEHYGTINPELSRIRVYSYRGIDVPVSCRMCSTPQPCIEACPFKPPKPKAISIDKDTGAIVVDEKRCLGEQCGKCAEACPAKAIRFHPHKNYALICDLCNGDPKCVKECPVQCLEFTVGPADWILPEHYAYPPNKIAEDLRNTVYFHEKHKKE